MIGRVQSVGATRCEALLLGDPNLQVAVRVEPDGEDGIVASGASSPQENNMVDLGHLSGASAARPGETVITSGLGGIFPAGIPVGTIVDVRRKDNGLTTDARVKLFANPGKLEEVWVMAQ